MAIAQTVDSALQESFERLGLDDEARDWLRVPDRELAVKVPVTRDDGTRAVFQGFRVQHNAALGPYKGGMRLDDDVSLEGTRALAQLMTVKTALAGIPFGGAKGGVACPAKELSEAERERLARQLARALAPNVGPDLDIIAPDMNVDEQVMAWFADEWSAPSPLEPAVVTGKPVELGGSVGRAAATGRGVAIVVERLAPQLDLDLDGARVAVEGSGSAGLWAARCLAALGCRIVAMSKSDGAVHAEAGLDLDAVAAHLDEHASYDGFEGGEPLDPQDLHAVECELLVPAARASSIDGDGAQRPRCRAVVEAANGPLTPEADACLAARDIDVVPDVLANTGGVVVSYLEWLQNRRREHWDEERVDGHLRETLQDAVDAVVERARERDLRLRQAAYDVALERVLAAARTLRAV